MTESVAHKPILWRLVLIFVVMVLCVGAIFWKLTSLHVLQKEFLQGQGDARTIRTEPLSANRGMITDRNGEPLAVSTPVKSIWVNPKEISQELRDIEVLAKALDIEPATLAGNIAANADKEFLFVKRRISPAEADGVLALGIDGVYARQEYQRYYPQGEIAAHVVGFTNVDDEGQEGMELAFEDWLRGIPGRQQVMKDRRGRIIRELDTLAPAQPGKNLELSIDFRLQNHAYKELKAEYLLRGARSASVVVMDVHTGEVLAMANQPSYNPNNRGIITDFSALRNRAMTDLVEPGSTAKAFTVAAALESGMFTPETLVDTNPGRMRVGRDWVTDATTRAVNHGVLTVQGVITKSSNVGATKLALAIGHDRLRDMLERVGFGTATGTGFPGERSGVLPNHRIWHDIETATLSYGYGLSVTALQLASAYTTLVSGGIKKPVSMLKLSPESLAALPTEHVISEDIAHNVMSALETVVDKERGGGATAANVPYYSVAGKTGTAHVVGASGYESHIYNSLFVGYAPASDPRIVVVIIMNEPGGNEHYGSQVAAPLFSKIVTGAMRILNVTPDRLDDAQLLELSAL
ncbi:MAG: penicillin-binding protein 2 [Pseudomonadales bacterium]|nr:penicillin-binding protein 2 [Pseudomonadales bacterium]MCP5358764.1 penicillin-binding protein 2 [Pseudomonadales bacterium]